MFLCSLMFYTFGCFQTLSSQPYRLKTNTSGLIAFLWPLSGLPFLRSRLQGFFSCAIAGILFRKRKRRSWPAASSIRDNLSLAGNAAKWQGPWSHHIPRSCPFFFCPEKPEAMKNRGRGRWRGSYLLNAQKIVVRELDGERAWSKEPLGLSGREEALEEGGRGRQ